VAEFAVGDDAYADAGDEVDDSGGGDRRSLSSVSGRSRLHLAGPVFGPVGLVGVGVVVGAGAVLAFSPELRAKLSRRLVALNLENDKRNQPADAG